MTVQSIPTNTPVNLAGVYSSGLLIRNSGKGAIYIGNDSSLTAQTRALTIPRKGTLTWRGDGQLWAIAETAGGELELSQDVTASSTPGPDEVTVAGPVTVSGAVSIPGVVDVKGNVSLVGPIAITGPVNVTGKVDASGSTVAVTGPVNIGTIESTVNVNPVKIDGPININGTVPVSGAVSVTGTVSIPGKVDVQGNVGVTGPVTLSGPITVNGKVDASGSTVGISGPVTVGSITSNVNINPVKIDGPVNINGTVPINGDVTVSGPVNVNPVTIAAPVAISGTVPVNGDVTISGPVSVNPVTISAPVSIAGTVPVSGNVGVSGPVTVNGSVGLTGGSVSLSGPVSIAGGVSVDGSVINVGNNIRSAQTTVQLFTRSTALASGDNVLGTFNVTDYQSVAISIGTPATTAAASTIMQRVIIEWLTPSGVIIAQDSPWFSATGVMGWTGMVKTTSMRVRIVTSALSSGLRYNAPIVITGSTIALPPNYFHEPGSTSRFINCSDGGSQMLVQSNMVSIQADVSAGQVGTVLIPNAGRRITGSILTTSMGASVRLVALPITSPFAKYVQAISTDGNLRTFASSFPYMPIAVEINNNAASSTTYLSIIFES